MPQPSLKHAALLLIDVINDMNFPGSEKLLKPAGPAAKRIAALASRMRSAGVPVIYVNDNFGDWQADFSQLVERCTAPESPGREVSQLLAPQPGDYFVLKPKHSGFFGTSLEILLGHLGTRTLILAGFAADICVLYTANDAYMRDFSLVVPSDCVASDSATKTRAALEHMHDRLKARVCKEASISPDDG